MKTVVVAALLAGAVYGLLVSGHAIQAKRADTVRVTEEGCNWLATDTIYYDGNILPDIGNKILRNEFVTHDAQERTELLALWAANVDALKSRVNDYVTNCSQYRNYDRRKRTLQGMTDGIAAKEKAFRIKEEEKIHLD